MPCGHSGFVGEESLADSQDEEPVIVVDDDDKPHQEAR